MITSRSMRRRSVWTVIKKQTARVPNTLTRSNERNLDMRILATTFKQVKKSKRDKRQKPTQRKQPDYKLLFKALDHSLANGVNAVRWHRVGL